MQEHRTIPVHARLSPAVYAAVKARAEQERRPLATMLALMIEDAVKDVDPGKAAQAA